MNYRETNIVVMDGKTEIKCISRIPRKHRGWESVTYKGKRYQVFGGIRTPEYINIQHPIKGKKGIEYQ